MIAEVTIACCGLRCRICVKKGGGNGQIKRYIARCITLWVDSTMPTKSLGTLAMINAIGELQNPLLRKTMLCKRDMNNSASRSNAFLHS